MISLAGAVRRIEDIGTGDAGAGVCKHPKLTLERVSYTTRRALQRSSVSRTGGKVTENPWTDTREEEQNQAVHKGAASKKKDKTKGGKQPAT